jgi:hypothetical protein
MKKLILLLTLGLFLLSACSNNNDNVTGRDRTKIEKKAGISKYFKKSTEESVEPKKESISETPKVVSDDSKTFTVTLDGNESFWWVLVEFDDMKGNTLVMQDHPYLDFDELKEQLKEDFQRPKENPFLLNFIQISREMYITNSTSK